MAVAIAVAKDAYLYKQNNCRLLYQFIVECSIYEMVSINDYFHLTCYKLYMVTYKAMSFASILELQGHLLRSIKSNILEFYELENARKHKI